MVMMMLIRANGDNDEKVDFKDLLWRHRAQCAPGWPPLLLVDRATKTAFGGKGGLLRGLLRGGCLFDWLSGRRWIWIKGLLRQPPRSRAKSHKDNTQGRGDIIR